MRHVMRTSPPALGLAVALAVALAACADQADPPTNVSAPAAPALAAASGSLFGLDGRGDGGAGRPCTAPAYRQFDFWVGSWEVNSTGGGFAGVDRITRDLGGCAVLEDWHDATGGRGRSLNAYDAADRQWHQHWVDATGFVPLALDGRFSRDTMALAGTRPTSVGPVTDRIRWTAVSPDEVRQIWEESLDGGQSWPSLIFDGTYLRRASVTPPAEVPGPFCSSPGFTFFRAFDFTLGRWTVQVDGPAPADAALVERDPGALEAESEITTDLSGCLVEEHLTGRAGYEARVFTDIRPRDRRWLRTYVDDRGLRVFLTGQTQADGSIALEGEMPDARGVLGRVRATWTSVSADQFVQRWERSGDGGITWTRLLDATYTRQ